MTNITEAEAGFKECFPPEPDLIMNFRQDLMNSHIGIREFELFVPNHQCIDNNFWPFHQGHNKAKTMDEVNDFYILFTLANNVFTYPGIDTFDEKTTRKLIYTYLDRHPELSRRFMAVSLEETRTRLLSLKKYVAPLDTALLQSGRYPLPGKFEGKLLSKMQFKHLVGILLTTVQAHPKHPAYSREFTYKVIGEILGRKEFI